MITLLILVVIVAYLLIRAKRTASSSISKISLADVDYMDGHDFEYFCADLLKYDGFSHISVTKGSNDQGVDIIAYRNGKKHAIQCKRYNNALGNKPVQEVNTGRAIYGCSQAIVLTNNYFTKGAVQAARATGVILWDRRKLDSLIKAKQRNLNKHTSLSFTTNIGNKIITFPRIGIVVIVCLILFVIVGGNRNRRSRIDIHNPKNEIVSTNLDSNTVGEQKSQKNQ